MITNKICKYQKNSVLLLIQACTLGTLMTLAGQAAEGQNSQGEDAKSVAELRAEHAAMKAQLQASRKEAAKYKEIAQKNRTTALKLKEVALKWQEHAKRWQNATHLAQAEAQEMRNKFQEVNAKLHAGRALSPQGERGNSLLPPAASHRGGARQDGQPYGYNQIGDMTNEITRIREQRREEVDFAEQMLQESFGGKPARDDKPRHNR